MGPERLKCGAAETPSQPQVIHCQEPFASVVPQIHGYGGESFSLDGIYSANYRLLLVLWEPRDDVVWAIWLRTVFYSTFSTLNCSSGRAPAVLSLPKWTLFEIFYGVLL